MALAPHQRVDSKPEETPAEYAARLADGFTRHVPIERRRELAQFFTPLDVARFMAMLARPRRSVRRLLDPSAGTGVLAGALCETLVPRSGPVHLDAYEVDQTLAHLCHTTLTYTQQWLAGRGTPFTFTVYQTDYVVENAAALEPLLFGDAKPSVYDIAVVNPPYFKLQKRDPRAMAASAIVHGQPNIYALFMAITANLLAETGVMVTITPRSFATGDYFRRFRQHLLATVTPETVHVFHSRKETFRSDAVLQENIILVAKRGQPSPSVTVAVSMSEGTADLKRRQVRIVSLGSVVDLQSRDMVFNIPVDETDDAVISFVRSWPSTLHGCGLEVSTGPVVAFRARDFLLHISTDERSSAPLLWLQHVRRMVVRWPLVGCPKPQYILDTESARPLLIRNGTYILLRRFTAKEESRRLVAAPLFNGDLPGQVIGLENHLNYIHRPHGTIQDDEAVGLVALLGSVLLDCYFRVSNGHTQVNAAELRTLPLPPLRSIVTLGSEIRRQSLRMDDIETAVAEVLHLPSSLRNMIEAKHCGES